MQRIYHTHPVWLTAGRPVAGFKAYPHYVTFMIWNAAPMTDTSGVLVAGTRMSSVKIAAQHDLDPAAISNWLAQATAEGMPA